MLSCWNKIVNVQKVLIYLLTKREKEIMFGHSGWVVQNVVLEV